MKQESGRKGRRRDNKRVGQKEKVNQNKRERE